MNVSEAIRTKRAVRSYRADPLPEEVVRAILHAGRRAQSAKNDQPWHFIAIRERSMLRALAATSPNIAHIAESALTVAIVTPPPSRKLTILFDAGQAAACMQLVAWELGVVSCLATVYELEQARRLLEFPDDMHLHLAIAFGYPQPADAEPRTGRKGGRRTLDDAVHWDRW
ncbi:MAG: nitroreductase family protein [Gammaproteobacteria bacterium]